MNSRMSKYYRDNTKESKRSERNNELYQRIYEDTSYTNIEGIANIEKTNEIDINKIRELLKGEEIKKEPKREIKKEFNNFLEDNLDEEKSYDIRDVLNKAKTEREDESNEIRSLRNTQYNILKSLKINNKNEEINGEEELKELINTITSTSILNKLGDKELSLKMFEDLKSSGNTIVETVEPICEVKNEIDKSFYTSSLNFKDEDFEELKEINTTLKKNNVLIKILLFLLFLMISSVVVYFIVNFLGKV